VAQQTGRQYDDDLTVGADDYKESFSTGYVDLFEPLGDDDAPIAKLKTIVLSIDWEITDDILQQLHDELLDLKDVWAGNKINLIYIQALEKLGRYISTEKAKSHPNAIKLLLGFYYNLEKIVSSSSMSEEEKKRLLLQDVKKFDQFKLQIAPGTQEKKRVGESPGVAPAQVHVSAVTSPSLASQGQKGVLTNLKAIVLSIDWEISDKELARLSEEVSKLEKTFSDSRAKLIFLQGLGALGNYIRSTKSKAHPDAFKLFHSFYAGLERICTENLTSDQEKKILLVEVGKFNAFKAVIATVASAVVVPTDEPTSFIAEDDVEEEEGQAGAIITPAFADMSENVRGFRADADAVKGDIDTRVASFLGDDEGESKQRSTVVTPPLDQVPEYHEVDSSLDALFGDDEESAPMLETSDVALSGVDVETEADDDSDEKALPVQAGALAPALTEANGQSLYAEKMTPAQESRKPSLDVTAVIPGVDVETEADDESDEAALPREQGGVAPALAFSEEKYGFREADLVVAADEDESDLEDRLHSFFGVEIEEASQGKSLSLRDDTGETEALLPTETALEEPSLRAIQEGAQGAFVEAEDSGPVSLSESFDLTSMNDDTEQESVVSLLAETSVFNEVSEEVEPEDVGAALEEPGLSDVQEGAQGVFVEAEASSPVSLSESFDLTCMDDDTARESVVSLVAETSVLNEVSEEVEPEDVGGVVEEPGLSDVQEGAQGVFVEAEASSPVSLSESFDLTCMDDDTARESVVSLVAETSVLNEVSEEVEPEDVGAVVEEPIWSDVSDLAEDQTVLLAEEPAIEEPATEEPVLEVMGGDLADTADIEELEPTIAGVIFAGIGAGLSPGGMSETLEVVFEPVDDDVEVDELPVVLGAVVSENEIVREQNALVELRECISLILLKKYDEAFPAFLARINGLRQEWQGQYVNTLFLQLMLTVGQYIETYRMEADAEAFTLLQSLSDQLEQHFGGNCMMKTDRGTSRDQMLAEEVGKVLLWQQGMIATLKARQQKGDSFSGVVGGPADLFSGE
jgi:pilus assembly protein FimV